MFYQWLPAEPPSVSMFWSYVEAVVWHTGKIQPNDGDMDYAEGLRRFYECFDIPFFHCNQLFFSCESRLLHYSANEQATNFQSQLLSLQGGEYLILKRFSDVYSLKQKGKKKSFYFGCTKVSKRNCRKVLPRAWNEQWKWSHHQQQGHKTCCAPTVRTDT